MAGTLSAYEDQRLQVSISLATWPTPFRAQLLGELDRPVGDGINFGGTMRPAKVDDRGRLLLDDKANGKFRTISRRQVVTFSLLSGKKKNSIRLEFRKTPEGAWVYRNLTVLLLKVGRDVFMIADVNGDGDYNEAGVDGMAWPGKDVLFPLPSESERWCSRELNLTGLIYGPLGETPAIKGHVLKTTLPRTLPILKEINELRSSLGLTPRPEDPELSADLQKHCDYMAKNKLLTHPEEKGKPGYSEEGHKAGRRSILSQGTPPERIASGMVRTYFHRQDVIRPGTLGFGVGFEDGYGGIDGRARRADEKGVKWPILCPMPGQPDAGVKYGKEAPDATPGDASAGYPITAYFGTKTLKLKSHSLKILGRATGRRSPRGAPAGAEVSCYVYDPTTGASSSMSGYQRVVCIISKEPLKSSTVYEVRFEVEVDGKPWKKTWRFATGSGGQRGVRR